MHAWGLDQSTLAYASFPSPSGHAFAQVAPTVGSQNVHSVTPCRLVVTRAPLTTLLLSPQVAPNVCAMALAHVAANSARYEKMLETGATTIPDK